MDNKLVPRKQATVNPLHLEGEEWFRYFEGWMSVRFPCTHWVVLSTLLNNTTPNVEDLEKAIIVDTVIGILRQLPEEAKLKLLKELEDADNSKTPD